MSLFYCEMLKPCLTLLHKVPTQCYGLYLAVQDVSCYTYRSDLSLMCVFSLDNVVLFCIS